MTNKIKWIFFDVGTTLVDETKAYDHRIKDAIAGTDISFAQFQEKRIFFAKQNLRGDLEAIKYFGLRKTPWHKEDEIPYAARYRSTSPIRMPGKCCGILQQRGIRSVLLQISLSERLGVLNRGDFYSILM